MKPWQQNDKKVLNKNHLCYILFFIVFNICVKSYQNLTAYKSFPPSYFYLQFSYIILLLFLNVNK